MSDHQLGSINLPPIDQVGFLVKDMEKAIAYYGALFGEFQVSEHELKEAIFRGKTCDCKLSMAIAMSGPLEIELIQPLGGDNPYDEFLEEHGEGLHHLRFPIENLEETLKALAAEGIEPFFQKSFPEFGVAFAYVANPQKSRVVFELIQKQGA
ncbi:MAG: VOC family protein [Deltaproteobacteria bacterium]|nr:VOC family protein [Deltaproteobacteria bacterium]